MTSALLVSAMLYELIYEATHAGSRSIVSLYTRDRNWIECDDEYMNEIICVSCGNE